MQSPDAESPPRENESRREWAEAVAARLRKTGLVILFAGIFVGGLIYAFGPLDDASEGNSLQTEYYKNQELETQRLWGSEGALVLELTRLFKRASTYSVIVITASAAFSLVCFFRAKNVKK